MSASIKFSGVRNKSSQVLSTWVKQDILSEIDFLGPPQASVLQILLIETLISLRKKKQSTLIRNVSILISSDNLSFHDHVKHFVVQRITDCIGSAYSEKYVQQAAWKWLNSPACLGIFRVFVCPLLGIIEKKYTEKISVLKQFEIDILVILTSLKFDLDENNQFLNYIFAWKYSYVFA